MTVVGGVFLAASFVLMLSGADFPLDPAWITALICGLPMMFEAAEALFCRRKISSPLLISIAMVASVCIGEVFAAGEIAFIMAVGEILEHMTVARAKRGIKNLVNLAPDTGRVIVGGAAKTVAVAEIKVGDTVRILPGETIPVDGKILSGNTSVDQSVVTGESIPADKSAGDNVFCGTVNRFGAIDVSTTRRGRRFLARQACAARPRGGEKQVAVGAHRRPSGRRFSSPPRCLVLSPRISRRATSPAR